MSYGLVLVFENVDESAYWAVNEQLGINRDGTGDWPDGLASHSGTQAGTGFVVMEIWDSKGHQERFMADRLGVALGAVGVPAPAQVIDGDVVNHHQRG